VPSDFNILSRVPAYLILPFISYTTGEWDVVVTKVQTCNLKVIKNYTNSYISMVFSARTSSKNLLYAGWQAHVHETKEQVPEWPGL